MQDFLATHLLMPPPPSSSSFSESSTKGLPPDTPHSIEESVDMAFAGVPTPENSFLDEDEENIELDQDAFSEDGSFNIDLIQID